MSCPTQGAALHRVLFKFIFTSWVCLRLLLSPDSELTFCVPPCSCLKQSLWNVFPLVRGLKISHEKHHCALVEVLAGCSIIPLLCPKKVWEMASSGLPSFPCALSSRLRLIHGYYPVPRGEEGGGGFLCLDYWWEESKCRNEAMTLAEVMHSVQRYSFP